MAAGLACYLDPLTGRYHGFDPVPKGIAWCNQAFAAYPHFRFEQADVFNEHYWPQGRVLATDYHFPLPDWSVDFAIATSVHASLLRRGRSLPEGSSAGAEAGGRAVLDLPAV